jgi:23S rRNA (uracil1939-C5)-methyltransferase
MNDLAHALEKLLPPLPGLDRVQARINEKGELLLSFIGDADIATPLEVIIPDLLPDFPELVGSVVLAETETVPLYGTSYLIETVGDLSFRVSPESFFQINRSVTAELLAYLNTLIVSPVSTLLDLYTGVGLFAISLNKHAEHVIAVESSAFAVTDAEVNLEQNGIENVELIQGSVEKLLSELDEKVDIALVDPPRSGCPPEVLHWLSENTTQQILYVSCDPTTLARDLKQLTESGWRIEAVQPFDMFPQTFHVETVVSLKRGS